MKAQVRDFSETLSAFKVIADEFNITQDLVFQRQFPSSPADEEIRHAVRTAVGKRRALFLTCPDCKGLGKMKLTFGGPEWVRPIDCHTCAGKGQLVRTEPLCSMDWPIDLTPEQKLAALGARFYGDLSWKPASGDYYTTSRADLELYQVVAIEEGIVFTRYCDRRKSTTLSEWPVDEFTSSGFGPKRVFVPRWVFTVQ